MAAVVKQAVPYKREYTSHPFDLMANGPVGCLYSCFCLPCAAGDVADAVGDSYALTCLSTCFFPCISVLPRMMNRDNLNKQYNLKDPFESPIVSCLYTFFCGCCKAIQELNLIKQAELNGWTPSQTIAGPSQMHMGPGPSIYQNH